MNKSMKFLSLALLLSGSFVVAEEVAAGVESVAPVTKSIKEHIKDAFNEASKSIATTTGKAVEATEEAFDKFADKVEAVAEADKTAYIKANIKSFITSLSATEEEQTKATKSTDAVASKEESAE